MKFGAHTQLVQEVLDFASSGNLLQPLDSIQRDEWVIITNLEEAEVFAWQLPCGKEEYLWTDIRERAMSDVLSSAYSIPSFVGIGERIAREVESLVKIVKSRVTQQHRELVDDIIGDLRNCAFNRAINGLADLFFEQMFSIYRAGGWPCGWQGDYPSGKFLTYFPPRN